MEAIMCCEFYHGLEDICILFRAVASDKIYYYPSKNSNFQAYDLTTFEYFFVLGLPYCPIRTKYFF